MTGDNCCCCCGGGGSAAETVTDVGGGGTIVVVVIEVGTIDIEVAEHGGGGKPRGGQAACIDPGTSPVEKKIAILSSFER